MLRTNTCGELTGKDMGKSVVLCGWVHSRRDHGGIVFVDLRDRYGLTQVVFDPLHNKESHKVAEKIGREYVLRVVGKVRRRKPGMENPKLHTGEIEIITDALEILNASDVPPLEIDDKITANEEVRLKYRYLDLRRPIMQKQLAVRHLAAQASREFLNSQHFLEIETPMFIKSTPEGARDYVVPSRVNPGMFYALPQSPQIYKQILMVAGFDRYYQLARCMRDEDLRADRQPEFTQIDLEMAFAEQSDVLEIIEGTVKHVFKKVLNKDLPKFPVMKYDETMEKYGTDKPDLRFGLELIDVADIAKKSEFNVFKTAESVKCLPVSHEISRGDIDKLIEWAKEQGSKGLAWMKVSANGLESSIVKFFNADLQKELLAKSNVKSGVLFFIADTKKKTNDLLARLRNKLGHDLGLIKDGEFKFCWIVDFPMFEWNEEEERWDFQHNPFAMPKKEHWDILEKSPGKVYADLYDLVLNGTELGSGAIRINRPDIQEKVFKITGLSKEKAKEKFGFLLDAYKYGGPPHGGFAVGFDRLVALMQGITDIREVIVFPKTKSGENPMDGSPSEIDEKQMKELHLKSDVVKK